jgi:tetratricopeptide (TPR) repeat protein
VCSSLLGSLGATASAQASSSDETLYENVHQLLNDGKSDDALTAVNAAIASGGTPMAYTLRCEIYTRLQKYDIAAPDCAKALQLAPNFPLAHRTEGDRLYDSGDLQGSLKEYDAYLALNPADAGGNWRRCDARRRLGDWTGAKADCDKAIAAYPNNPSVRISRGRIELQNKAYDSAYADFDFAATARPTDTVALYWRGYTALQMSRYGQAVADFTAAINNGDKSPDTYFSRAHAYLGLGKKDLAKNDWDTGIALDRQYGQCNDANAMAMLETAIFGGNQVTAVVCK